MNTTCTVSLCSELFDSLLALLGIEVARHAKTSLVLGHVGPNDRVLASLGEVLVVTLDGIGTRFQSWPVDL